MGVGVQGSKAIYFKGQENEHLKLKGTGEQSSLREQGT